MTKLNFPAIDPTKPDNDGVPFRERANKSTGNDFFRAMTHALSESPASPGKVPVPSPQKISRHAEGSKADEKPSIKNHCPDRRAGDQKDDSSTASSLLAALAQPLVSPSEVKAVNANSNGEAEAVEDSVKSVPNDSMPDEMTSDAADELAGKESDPTKSGMPSPTTVTSQTLAVADNDKLSLENETVAKTFESAQKPFLIDPTLSGLKLEKDVKPAIISDGTSAAKLEQRMKFSREKNKIAEQTVQKLPHAISTEEASSEVEYVKSDSGFDFSEHKEKFSSEVSSLDLLGNPRNVAFEKGLAVEGSSSVNHAANQVERLSKIVVNEFLAFKQTGANALSVSLKLDSKTEISLGLTTHAGQVQASIRCERGNLSEVEGHWGQLQESLARHNVQLLPLTENGLPKQPGFNSASNTPFRDSDQSPKWQNREQIRDSSEKVAMANTATGSDHLATTLNNLSNQKGWESWA